MRTGFIADAYRTRTNLVFPPGAPDCHDDPVSKQEASPIANGSPDGIVRRSHIGRPSHPPTGGCATAPPARLNGITSFGVCLPRLAWSPTPRVTQAGWTRPRRI